MSDQIIKIIHIYISIAPVLMNSLPSVRGIYKHQRYSLKITVLIFLNSVH